MLKTQVVWERAKISKRLADLATPHSSNRSRRSKQDDDKILAGQRESLEEQRAIAKSFKISQFIAEKLSRLLGPSMSRRKKHVNDPASNQQDLGLLFGILPTDIASDDRADVEPAVEKSGHDLDNIELLPATTRKARDDLVSRLLAAPKVASAVRQASEQIQRLRKLYVVDSNEDFQHRNARSLSPVVNDILLPEQASRNFPSSDYDMRAANSSSITTNSDTGILSPVMEQPSQLLVGRNGQLIDKALLISKIEQGCEDFWNTYVAHQSSATIRAWAASISKMGPRDFIPAEGFTRPDHIRTPAVESGSSNYLGASDDIADSTAFDPDDGSSSGSCKPIARRPQHPEGPSTHQLLYGVSSRLQDLSQRPGHDFGRGPRLENPVRVSLDKRAAQDMRSIQKPAPALPALLGGYFSGSDSQDDLDSDQPSLDDDVSDSEADADPISRNARARGPAAKRRKVDAPSVDKPQRKNRRGQRERQAIWEKKFKDKANHVQKMQTEKAATSSRRIYGEAGGPHNRQRQNGGRISTSEMGAHSVRGQSGFDRSSVALGSQRRPNRKERRLATRTQGAEPGSGANTSTLGSFKQSGGGERGTGSTAKEHPSWIAARKQKEVKQNAQPMGKKVVF